MKNIIFCLFAFWLAVFAVKAFTVEPRHPEWQALPAATAQPTWYIDGDQRWTGQVTIGGMPVRTPESVRLIRSARMASAGTAELVEQMTRTLDLIESPLYRIVMTFTTDDTVMFYRDGRPYASIYKVVSRDGVYYGWADFRKEK